MDKYDEAVAFLTERPDLIRVAWGRDALQEEDRHHQCLFDYVTPEQGEFLRREDGQSCGCLTQIKGGNLTCGVAWTDELTEAIRADDRIPDDDGKITVEDLPVFAEWQRRIDKDLGRK